MRLRANMPENYKAWSANVNLISDQFPRFVPLVAYLNDLSIGPARYQPDAPLNLFPIRRAPNDIRGQHDRGLRGVAATILSVFKPAFRCQKNKNQNQHAQDIPLPRCSRICPEDNL